MWLTKWFRPPGRWLLLFLIVTLFLAGAWGWLGIRLLQQERALESQRIQERLDHAADLVAAALVQSISKSQDGLGALLILPNAQRTAAAPGLAKDLGRNTLIVGFDSQDVEATPADRLLYYPFLPEPKGPPESVFALGETLEFQAKDWSKAIELYRKLANSGDAGTRAGALLRLARTLRKTRQFPAASATYDQLARMGAETVGGLPAELVAREGRCELLEEAAQIAELQREARSLDADLHSGRWRLTRPVYFFYERQTRRWLNPDQDPQSSKDSAEQDALALAAGVEALWEDWQRVRRGEGAASGWRSAWLYDRPVLVLWRSTSEHMVGLVAGSEYVEQHLLRPARPLVDSEGVQIGLTDVEGHYVLPLAFGAALRRAVRTASDTRLPWTLVVASRDPAGEAAQVAARRRFLLAGFALIAAVVLVGAYFTARAMMRELEVARLQSDFVSAVSHEFRTPLASLCQLSELLADGRVPSERRRQEYYQALSRESERLRRLVEGLLDFGRMEAGAKEYHFETLDPAALVREVVDEFVPKANEQGFRVEANCSNGLPWVRADRGAVSLAIWNLLDNAVKYSPGSKQVWVETRTEGNRVAICVRDRGLGIAPKEKGQLFKKFVRGASARAAGVKGTGLGLAMVQHIVAAHGGAICLESQPGAGSAFTILLPEVKR